MWSVATTNSWRDFFDAHAPVYDDNVFTANTVAEVDFLLEELGLAPGGSMLDVGCGTGRHAVELARRGYEVTGLDLSAAMLARARGRAEAAGVRVELVEADATRFSFEARFDAAVCLCEGSLGLLSATDDPIEQPVAILSNIARSLRPGGVLVLTALNAIAMFRRFSDADVADGRFDPVRTVEFSEVVPVADADPVPVRERGFTPSELTALCRLAGLQVVAVWGGTAGSWGRRPVDLDEIEIMVVARRAAQTAQSGAAHTVADIGPSSPDVETAPTA